MTSSSLTNRVLTWSRLDMAPSSRPPSGPRTARAGAVTISASLGFDDVLVKLGTSLFPAIRGYSHFRFGDYGLLAVIGDLGACAFWPLVTRLSSSPRWLFFRLVIVVTVLLWTPDLWLLVRHAPGHAVVVLVAMHLAITVITYNVLVHLAAARADVLGPNALGGIAGADTAIATRSGETASLPRPVWVIMASATAAVALLGLTET